MEPTPLPDANSDAGIQPAPTVPAASPPSYAEIVDEHGHRRNGRFAPGNPHCWKPGQSGNPCGRRKRGVSFAAALARQAIQPVENREEMANLARKIGLDPAKAKNIDVVAALFYTVLCRLLLRAATTAGRSDDRIVGMLTVLLRALDPAELRVTGHDGGPIPIATVVANVQLALGMHTAGAVVEGPARHDVVEGGRLLGCGTADTEMAHADRDVADRGG